MKTAIIISFCCLLFITSFSQKNLREGFVVLNNNDTLTGFIDYREWYRNPNSILFSQSKESGRQWYSGKDIKCFAVNVGEMYERFYVRISMDRQSLNNIDEKDTASKTDTVFLKVLQTGKNITLFSYSDDIKRRLYILPANETTPVELQNSEYISNGNVINEMEYRSVLLDIARRFVPEYADIQALIDNQTFSEKNIMDIGYKINGINGEIAIQKEKNKLSRVAFFAGIGVNRGLITFTGDNRYAGKTTGANYSPVVSGGADIFVNPAIGRLFLRSQLSFSSYKTEAYTFTNYFEAKENYYLKFKQKNIALHEQLNYNIYNGLHLKWFAGAGAGFNFSAYPQNEEKFIREGLSETTITTNDNYLSVIRKFWLNAAFRSGLTLYNFDIAVEYYPKSSISQYANFSVLNSSFQLKLNYLFGR